MQLWLPWASALDLDGDGVLDLAVCDQGGVTVLHGTGDGTFDVRVDLLSIAGGCSFDIAGDFNRDGRPDLALAGMTVVLNASR